MKTVPCKGCGKPIVFVEVMHGDGRKATVPLDLSAPVYAITEEGMCGYPNRAERRRAAYVSHFATCPKAGDFSASKKKTEAST